jgi:hypothetical protein
MRSIQFVCRLALPVGALLFGLNLASAQGVDVRQACTPDAMRLCADFIPDVPKITACMTAKRAQLSQECRSAMVVPSHRVARPRQVRRTSYVHSKHHG